MGGQAPPLILPSRRVGWPLTGQQPWAGQHVEGQPCQRVPYVRCTRVQVPGGRPPVHSGGRAVRREGRCGRPAVPNHRGDELPGRRVSRGAVRRTREGQQPHGGATGSCFVRKYSKHGLQVAHSGAALPAFSAPSGFLHGMPCTACPRRHSPVRWQSQGANSRAPG